MRTPLNGRTFEGFGEDPFLISRTAVAWIRAAVRVQLSPV
jgi:beta-glucosidase